MKYYRNKDYTMIEQYPIMKLLPRKSNRRRSLSPECLPTLKYG
jgi:hypothetical protein